ncbi:MAG: hypothetical protein P1U77_05805, partial [Rubripirellula sp.]|nr:hypothetical protein [Rubripirellula sp.]
MIDVIFVVFLAWAIVTVVGHVSWVIVRTLLRVITGTQDHTVPLPKPDQHSDLAATRRTIRRLHERELVSGDESLELQRKLRILESRHHPSTPHPSTPHPSTPHPSTPHPS